MQSDTPVVSRKALWAGRIISALAVLFLLFDGLIKVILLPPVVEGSEQLGYPTSTMPGIGLVLILCTLLYVFPRTSILGAVLLTGYLGGATATHVRVEDGLFPVFFSVGFGALVWLGLFLRDLRVRELFLPNQTTA